MKIHILNLSNTPAYIQEDEINKWLNFIKQHWFEYKFYEDTLYDSNKWIEIFNEIIESDQESIILFTSWWFDSVNKLKYLTRNVWNWNKYLLWFSDLLHIQYKYIAYDNVFNIYWITLRNIFELKKKEINALFNFYKYWKFDLSEFLDENLYNWEKLIGWHIMIFSLFYDHFELPLDNMSLFLEAHWLESYYINYLFDVLKYKWVLDRINSIVLYKDMYENEAIYNHIRDSFDGNIIKYSNEMIIVAIH